MVSLKDTRASNESLKLQPGGLVAVFAGATAGIGLHTLKQLAKHANAPRVYIIGRSKAKAASLLEELKVLNPEGTFVFLEAQFSLINDVDRVSEEIKHAEKQVDLLCMSPGYLSFAGREETKEGLETDLALQYYARFRLATNLLPLLNRSASPRIVSVFAAGQEGALDPADLDLRHNYSFTRATFAAVTMTNLAFEELAKTHPAVSFVHTFPGRVHTDIIDNLFKTVPGLLYYPAQVLRVTAIPLFLRLICITPEESGERTLFVATTARFPPAAAKGEGEADGKKVKFVPVSDRVGVATSTVVEEGKGNGVYRVSWQGDSLDESKIMAKHRGEGTGKVVWEHTLSVFERALGRGS